jgi:hypothetical protein
MIRLRFTLVFSFLLNVLIAQNVGVPDRAFQEGLYSYIRRPVIAPDGRIFYFTEGSTNNSSKPLKSTLYCALDESVLWSYTFDNFVYSYHIQMFPHNDKSLTVYYWEGFEGSSCIPAIDGGLVILHFSKSGELIKRKKILDTYFIDIFGYYPDFYCTNSDKFSLYTIDINTNRDKAIYALSYADSITVDTAFTVDLGVADSYCRPVLDSSRSNILWLIGSQKIYLIKNGIAIDDTTHLIANKYTVAIYPSPDEKYLTMVSYDTMGTYVINDSGRIELVSTNDNKNVFKCSGNDCYLFEEISVLNNGALVMSIFDERYKRVKTASWPSLDQIHTEPTWTVIYPKMKPYYYAYAEDAVMLIQEPYEIRDNDFESFGCRLMSYTWGTGDQKRSYPDLKMDKVDMYRTFAYEKSPDFYVYSAGGEATVFNNGSDTIRSFYLCALFRYFARSGGCERDSFSVKRFDGLSIAPGERQKFAIDSFKVIENASLFFDPNDASPINRKYLYVWTSAPNDLPDNNPYNDLSVVDDYFRIMDAPGSEFALFPNPVIGDSKIRIVAPETEYSRINFDILNTQGQLVRSTWADNFLGYYDMDIDDLTPGVYFLRSGNQTLKLVKL